MFYRHEVSVIILFLHHVKRILTSRFLSHFTAVKVSAELSEYFSKAKKCTLNEAVIGKGGQVQKKYNFAVFFQSGAST